MSLMISTTVRKDEATAQDYTAIMLRKVLLRSTFEAMEARDELQEAIATLCSQYEENTSLKIKEIVRLVSGMVGVVVFLPQPGAGICAMPNSSRSSRW